MTDTRDGTVVTFYSYKGGTGRTMALANVAWILAANGQRVLVVDWDLESPGLHRFFKPFLKPDFMATTPGVIQLIQEFEGAAAELVHDAEDAGVEPEFAPDMLRRHAAIDHLVTRLNWSHFPGDGRLDFLSAGRQNRDYATTLSGLNWDDFYARLNGAEFVAALRAEMKREYDYALIDSRTGFSDVADICTIEMPDILVDCFTLSEQGIDGAVQAANAVRTRYGHRNIRILPVIMRVDPAEKAKADAGRLSAKQRFAGLPVTANEAERDTYWTSTQVPYQAFYSYEEMLATFGEAAGTTGLLTAYEALTSYITDGRVKTLPRIDEALRERINLSFQRAYEEIALHYAPEDQVWAEWIAHVLVDAGIRVTDASATASTAGGNGLARRDLAIVSHVSAAGGGRIPRDALAVYVADLPAMRRLPAATSVVIAGQGQVEAAAVEQVLGLVGRSPTGRIVAGDGGPRFPGTAPGVVNLPAQYLPFSGREDDLKQLREQLTAGTSRPVVLQGLSGIGKTQVALAYAHRFRSSYDVVWWVKAHPIAFIDVQFGDLGAALGVALTEDAGESARAVVQHLTATADRKRWLLILDNAEDIERVSGFVPAGGHVLITSRNPNWGTRADIVEVNVFRRDESVELLRRRVSTLGGTEADRVAGVVGDMPFAVATAAAYMAETGLSAEEYVALVEQSDPVALPSTADQPDGDDSYAGSAVSAWLLSIEALRARSAAAHRLFELCCVLDQEIALGLVYNEQVAAALKPLNPLVERNVLPSLVQHANRLQLLKVDQRGERGEASQRGQIVVHTLMQRLVRARMSADELARTRHQMHLVLARSRPHGEVDNLETWPQFRALWSHLEASDAVNCEDPTVRELLIDRVRYLWLRGDFERGLDRGRQTEQVWADRLAELNREVEAGREPGMTVETLHRQLLLLRFNMANILRDLGRFTESMELDEATLAAQLDLLGAEHPDTLLTAGGLAADLRALGRYAEALERDRTTYAAWPRVYGEEHPRTLAARNNLAVSYRLTGDYRSAMENDEEVYRGRYAVLGERHPNTLASAGHIGRDLREAGDYRHSVDQLSWVADAYVQPPPLPTRITVLARTNLAISLRSTGQAAQAMALLDEAYEWLNAQQPDAPETLACRLSRGANFLALGDPRARPELEAVRAAYRRSLGDKHPHTIGCGNNLAMVARAEGRFDDALALAREAAEDFAAVLSDNHPYTLAARTNVAVCLGELDRVAEALAVIDDVVPRLEQVLGVHHADALRGRANQALLRQRAGQPGQNTVLAELHDELAALLGEQHPALSAFRELRYLHRLIDPQPF